jgi:hypothetical protein
LRSLLQVVNRHNKQVSQSRAAPVRLDRKKLRGRNPPPVAEYQQ